MSTQSGAICADVWVSLNINLYYSQIQLIPWRELYLDIDGCHGNIQSIPKWTVENRTKKNKNVYTPNPKNTSTDKALIIAIQLMIWAQWGDVIWSVLLSTATEMNDNKRLKMRIDVFCLILRSIFSIAVLLTLRAPVLPVRSDARAFLWLASSFKEFTPSENIPISSWRGTTMSSSDSTWAPTRHTKMWIIYLYLLLVWSKS